MRGLQVALFALAWHGCHPGDAAVHARPAWTSSAPDSTARSQERPAALRLTLIEGHYEIIGAAPDGDSIKFYPAGKRDWEALRGGARVRTNRRGGAQLRLEGIDALETHYAPGRGKLGVTHQPLDVARSAAQRLLEWLGFSNVTRNPREVVTAAEPERVAGYILSRFVDKYGRCVAFAFKGTHPGQSGELLDVEAAALHDSLNYHLLEQGSVYPTYHSPLPGPVRTAFMPAVHAARTARRGVWARDRTTVGFRVGTLEDVQREAYVLPTLFRRLMDYFEQNAGVTSLTGFREYLDTRDRRVRLISTGKTVDLDSLVEVHGQVVRLLEPIDDLLLLGP